jgi:hypothetical protein
MVFRIYGDTYELIILGFVETASIDQLVKNTNCGGKKIYTCCLRSSCWSKKIQQRRCIGVLPNMKLRPLPIQKGYTNDTRRIQPGYRNDIQRIQKRYRKDTENRR